MRFFILTVVCQLAFLGMAQQKPILLTESDFIVKNRSSETFYFGLAAGDVFNFTTDITSSIHGISVGEYNAENIFEVNYVDSIGNHNINIDHDGIYYIRFSQSGFLAGKRSCSLKAYRTPSGSGTAKFNSTVYWRTIIDTVYFTEDERFLKSIDTTVTTVASAVINLKKSNKKMLNNASIKFNLPDSCSYWSYYIANGKNGQATFDEQDKKLSETNKLVEKYGLMAAIAMNNAASFSAEPGCQAVKSFFIYPENGKNEVFTDSLNGFYGQFDSCLEFGKMKKAKKVPSYIGLRNDSKKPLTVLVKITAVHFKENWEIRKVEKFRVEERSEPYLKR